MTGGGASANVLAKPHEGRLDAHGPVPFSAFVGLGKKLSSKEVQGIQLERVREADDQFLNSCCLKICQALADGIRAADQRALCHISKATQQRAGKRFLRLFGALGLLE